MGSTSYQRTSSSHRPGFTIAEILVGLAIMSVLAAIVIPAVTGQISRSNATRTVEDLTGIRTAVEQFVGDVHRYPGKVSHLATLITVAQRDVNINVYPAGLVARWKGPYLGSDSIPGGYQTGFGAVVRDSLVELQYQPGVDYVTVVVAGIRQPDFNRVDLEVDGVVSAATGLLRWVTGGASGVDTVKFLMIPVQF